MILMGFVVEMPNLYNRSDQAGLFCATLYVVDL